MNLVPMFVTAFPPQAPYFFPVSDVCLIGVLGKHEAGPMEVHAPVSNAMTSMLGFTSHLPKNRNEFALALNLLLLIPLMWFNPCEFSVSGLTPMKSAPCPPTTGNCPYH